MRQHHEQHLGGEFFGEDGMSAEDAQRLSLVHVESVMNGVKPKLLVRIGDDLYRCVILCVRAWEGGREGARTGEGESV